MQPVHGNSIQHQVIPARHRTPDSSETASGSVNTPLRKNTVSLPDDVVTLSTDRISTLSLKKEPSAPVTPAESKALRDSFSVYA
ncbi:MAG: hypothetical protein HGB32_12970 [Geobacteraceae bacterium]|nr:hypothetical protein [Geobacteraceae bacterium]NTW81040.1 hypothetical protein [Geobacteraceae bacterium]